MRARTNRIHEKKLIITSTTVSIPNKKLRAESQTQIPLKSVLLRAAVTISSVTECAVVPSPNLYMLPAAADGHAVDALGDGPTSAGDHAADNGEERPSPGGRQGGDGRDTGAGPADGVRLQPNQVRGHQPQCAATVEMLSLFVI